MYGWDWFMVDSKVFLNAATIHDVGTAHLPLFHQPPPSARIYAITLKADKLYGVQAGVAAS
jgi:hypothetical protein